MGVGLAHHHAGECAADIDLAQDLIQAGNGVQTEGRGLLVKGPPIAGMGTGAGAGAAGAAAGAAASWAIAGAATPSRPARLTVPKNNFVKFFIYQVLSLPVARAHAAHTPDCDDSSVSAA